MDAFGKPLGAPDIDWFAVFQKRGRRCPHPVLLLHKFFGSFYRDRHADFMTTILGHKNACKEFWEHIQESNFVRNHPQLPRKYWTKAVPIGMHGDGGAFSDTDSLYTLSWNSMLGEAGKTITKRILFSVIRKSDLVADSLDELLRIFTWSMNTLLTGETPHFDHKGRPMTGGGAIVGWWL